VLEPALLDPDALARLRQLAENHLRYVEAATFPGGCFFASVASGMDTHPGPLRDVAIQFMADWLELLERIISEAQAEGSIDPDVDLGQLAFEIASSLFLANALFVINPDSKPTERERRTLERRFREVAAGS
jgi:AcrR family transcriptional regulator